MVKTIIINPTKDELPYELQCEKGFFVLKKKSLRFGDLRFATIQGPEYVTKSENIGSLCRGYISGLYTTNGCLGMFKKGIGISLATIVTSVENDAVIKSIEAMLAREDEMKQVLDIAAKLKHNDQPQLIDLYPENDSKHFAWYFP
ncbi:MAG: hypothetical protein V3V78_03465 [Candidatus Woesearchaeota archaeon]